MNIITHALKPEHRNAGLSLSDDEDFVYLNHNGRVVATFLWNIPVLSLWLQCDKYLEGKHASSHR